MSRVGAIGGGGRLRRVLLAGVFLLALGGTGGPRSKPSEVVVRTPAILPAGLERVLQISPNKRHDIQIRLARPAAWTTLPRWRDEAIAEGRITDETSLLRSRLEWIAQWNAKVEVLLNPVAAKVEAQGGRVLARYPMLLGLRIAVTRDMLMVLLREVAIVRVDGTKMLTADGAQTPDIKVVSSKVVREGHQLTLLEGDGKGEGSGLHVAIWEHDGWPYPDPKAWRQRYGGALSVRLHGCRRSDCSDARHSPHASATLAVLATDFLGGRVSSRNLTVHAYVVRQESLPAVIDRTLASEDDIRVVNMSASLDGRRDWSCRGVDLLSRDVDSLFENGILVIKSAGNDGDSDTSCTVGPPGAATSVLTVGALDAGKEDAQAVRTAHVLSTSGVGGLLSASHGSGGVNGTLPEVTERTVIDLTAQGCRQETIPGDGGTFIGCGTSFSTSTVTAVALLQLEDWARAGQDEDLHHHPGALMASLLLMGDGFRPSSRSAMQTNDAIVGFDRRVGAGRLRVRRIDGLTETCVANGARRYFLDEDGLVIPDDVNAMRAVLFWYDADIESTGTVNNLDLTIERRHNNGPPGHPAQWRTAVASVHPHDNKERVILRGVRGQRLRIVVRGTRVRTGTSGTDCEGAQRAHLAYAFE